MRDEPEMVEGGEGGSRVVAVVDMVSRIEMVLCGYRILVAAVNCLLCRDGNQREKKQKKKQFMKHTAPHISLFFIYLFISISL